MPKKIVVKQMIVSNQGGPRTVSLDGANVKIPMGRTPVDQIVLPEGLHPSITRESAAKHAARKSISNGVQTIRLDYESEVKLVPITRADLSADELTAIKEELRAEYVEEFKASAIAWEAREARAKEVVHRYKEEMKKLKEVAQKEAEESQEEEPTQES